METVIIDAEWEEIPSTLNKQVVQENRYKWIDLALRIEYGCLGICFALKVLAMLFISECE